MKEKRPPGRPVSVNGKLVMVNLDPESHAAAALLGHGNVSAGVRLALRRAMTPPAPPAATYSVSLPTPSYPPIPYPPGFSPKQ